MSAAKVSHGVTETRREDSASVRTSAVPSLRFKGFESAWISKELLEIVTFGKGRGYSKSDIKESGTPLFLYGRMYTAFQNEVASVDTFANAVEGSVLSKGKEVVVPASGETAEDIARASAITSEGIILGGDLNVLTPKNGVDINSVFLALVLSYGRARKQIEVRAQGKTVVHVHNTDLAEVMPSYPVCLDEQEKIQIGFRNVDTALLSRQSALAKLQALKKSMLVNMFPQGDAKVPKIRFKGFEGEWKEVGYPDIFDHIPSKRYQIQSSEYQECGAFPVLDQGKECVCGYSDNEYRVFRGSAKPVVIFGDHTREVKFADFDFVVGADGTQLLAPKKMDSLFAYYLLSHLTIPNMGYSRHFKFVVDAVFQCPEDILEQRKIAAYFKSLDRLIAARRDEIEELKHMKAALLNRMFV